MSSLFFGVIGQILQPVEFHPSDLSYTTVLPVHESNTTPLYLNRPASSVGCALALISQRMVLSALPIHHPSCVRAISDAFLIQTKVVALILMLSFAVPVSGGIAYPGWLYAFSFLAAVPTCFHVAEERKQSVHCSQAWNVL
jgi:hypothetical protein